MNGLHVGSRRGSRSRLPDESILESSLKRARRSVTQRSGPVSRSEEHTSELQSLMRISYAVFCLKKKKNRNELVHDQRVTSYTQSKTNQHTQKYILIRKL